LDALQRVEPAPNWEAMAHELALPDAWVQRWQAVLA